MGLLVVASWTVVVPEKMNVLVGTMALRMPQFVPSAVPALMNQTGAKHFYTVLEQPSSGTCMFYDFLPASADNPLVMATALLGREVQGVIQEKKLEKPPGRNCWLVGQTYRDNAFECAREFNRCWDSKLVLFRHDCRHYTEGLVGHLTGKKHVIEQIDEMRKRPS